MSTLLVLYFICPPLSPEGPPLPGFPLPQARASLSGEKRSPRTGLGPGQEVQTSAEEGMIFRKPQAGLSPVAFRPVLSPPGAVEAGTISAAGVSSPRERRPLQAAAGMHRSSRRWAAPAPGLRGLSPGARDSGAMHSGHSRLI